MAQTIVEMFYDTTGYSSSDISTASVTGTYIPFGEETLENLAQVTISIAWTGSGASSSGNIYDDKIIAEFAGYFADNKRDTVRINPETDEPENRHWEEAMKLLLAKYGILGATGEVVPPLYLIEEKALDYVVKSDGYQDSSDST